MRQLLPEAARARLLTPAVKYWICKNAPTVVYEAMECLGGNGYVEDGSNDPAYDWVTPFETITSCQVNVKTGGTSDEMVQLMQSGEYDGVSASGDATQRLMAGGEVVEIDPAEYPSYADVFEGLKLKPWNSLDGKPYGIPHGRGANLLVYNTEAFADGAGVVQHLREASAHHQPNCFVGRHCGRQLRNVRLHQRQFGVAARNQPATHGLVHRIEPEPVGGDPLACGVEDSVDRT